jgi:hypothetical protein
MHVPPARFPPVIWAVPSTASHTEARHVNNKYRREGTAVRGDMLDRMFVRLLDSMAIIVAEQNA